jgi:hypothetical protein
MLLEDNLLGTKLGYVTARRIFMGHDKNKMASKLSNAKKMEFMRQASAHLAHMSTAYKNLCMNNKNMMR